MKTVLVDKNEWAGVIPLAPVLREMYAKGELVKYAETNDTISLVKPTRKKKQRPSLRKWFWKTKLYQWRCIHYSKSMLDPKPTVGQRKNGETHPARCDRCTKVVMA